MATKEPVLLVVLVEAARLRWFVAAVALDAAVSPLLRSADGDLSTYQGLAFDDQVSFLRHRFCGIVQRGCDRLWPVGRKACQFAFIFDGELPGTTEELTRRVSDHFVEWMLNPPAVVYTSTEPLDSPAVPDLHLLAGTIDRALEDVLTAARKPLFAAAANADAWEVSTRKATWCPSAEGEPAG